MSEIAKTPVGQTVAWPTDLEGIYTRSVSLDEVEQWQDLATQVENIDEIEDIDDVPEDMIKVITEVIVDSEGKQFTDFMTVDDVKKHGIQLIKAVMTAMVDSLGLAGKGLEQAGTRS